MSTVGKTDAPGFTLVELLVVLLLMALSASLVFGLNLRQRDSLTLRDFGVSLGGYLQLARSTALTEGRSAFCLLDREKRVISCSLLSKNLPLPQGVRVVADGLPETDADLMLMEYFMDGSASGGRLILRFKESSASIEVDPLLGETTYLFEDSPDVHAF